MTEEEAKTKWCPFARYAAECGPAGNRWRQSLPEGEPHALNPVPCRCIGSACMAFRQHGWRDKEDGQLKSMAYERAEPQHWEPMFHCGLAGKP